MVCAYGGRSEAELCIGTFHNTGPSPGPNNLAEITRDVKEVRAIEHALLRLAQGRFGDCTDCGGPIEAARLHYEPAAPRCIECQERFERRDSGPRHHSL